MDGALDEGGGVPVDVELEPLGQLRLEDLHPRLHVAPHLHRVRAAQLGDAEADRRLAHGPHQAAPVLEPVLDDGDVLQPDRRAVDVGDDQIAEGLEVDGLALGAHVHLARCAFDAAGRNFLMLARDGVVHVEDGQAVRLEPRRVVPDAHVAVAEAENVDLAHPVDHLQLRTDHVADVVGEEDRRPVTRQRQR